MCWVAQVFSYKLACREAIFLLMRVDQRESGMIFSC